MVDLFLATGLSDQVRLNALNIDDCSGFGLCIQRKKRLGMSMEVFPKTTISFAALIKHDIEDHL